MTETVFFLWLLKLGELYSWRVNIHRYIGINDLLKGFAT